MAYDSTTGEWRPGYGSESGRIVHDIPVESRMGVRTHVVVYDLGLRTLVTEE